MGDNGFLIFCHDDYSGPDPKIDFDQWIHSMRAKLPGAVLQLDENNPKPELKELQELQQSVEELEMDLDQFSAELKEVCS